jgi:hypothetical protein
MGRLGFSSGTRCHHRFHHRANLVECRANGHLLQEDGGTAGEEQANSERELVDRLAVLGASAGCSKGQQQKLTETRQGDSSDDRGAKGLTAAKPAPESAMEITTMYEYLLAACCMHHGTGTEMEKFMVMHAAWRRRAGAMHHGLAAGHFPDLPSHNLVQGAFAAMT